MQDSILGVERIPVLLIEDSRSEARIIKSLLDESDDEFRLLSVTKLEDAMTELSHRKVGAIILDLGLPDCDGPESIKEIGGHYPDVPVVVLSGRNDPETIRHALEYGAQEFLSKNECSGKMIRRALWDAIFRKSLRK